MTFQDAGYSNGPLPAYLEPDAYFTGDRREWALPKAAALDYLDWCEREGLRVLGFEVWYPTTVADLASEIAGTDGVNPNNGATADDVAAAEFWPMREWRPVAMGSQLVGRTLVGLSLLASVGCSTSTMAIPQQPAVAARTTTSADPPLEPTEEESRWFHRYGERTLDQLMPLRSEGVIVAYRVAHTISPREIEGYFAIDAGKGYRLYGATVVTPAGKSIGEQLIRLHRAEPEASFESVLSRIKVDRRTTNVEACPDLFAQMASLHKIRVPMLPDPNVVHLDGMLHRIVVEGVIDVRDNDDDNPAARWAIETLRILTKCVQSR